LLKIAIIKPSNVDDLNDCVAKTKTFSNETNESILLCLSSNTEPVNEDSWEIPDPLAHPPQPVSLAVGTNDAINDVGDDILIINVDSAENNVNFDMEVEVDRVVELPKDNDCVGQESSNDVFPIVAFDKNTGQKFTLNDYFSRKHMSRTVKNYFKKKLKRLNRSYVNDHLQLQGLQPVKFRTNRGIKARQKAAYYCNKQFRN